MKVDSGAQSLRTVAMVADSDSLPLAVLQMQHHMANNDSLMDHIIIIILIEIHEIASSNQF